ncbi:uncharacterized protein [Pyrus communis]|uniref:uncharacterized protein n=1 Tax=Pyrus communis TaxID=23211 RepID=UPI0035C05102
MPRKLRIPGKVAEIQHANLRIFNGDVYPDDVVLQDVPTSYDQEYNNVSNSLLSHDNTTNPVQPYTSVLKQNASISDEFNSSSSVASTSHEITVPIFLANDATLRGILVTDTEAGHSVRSSHVIGQAAYQKKRKRGVPDYIDFGPRNFQCQYCGALFWSTERLKTNASSTRRPQFTACCMSQKVKFPPVKPAPAYLDHLLNPTNSQENSHFKKNVRLYNSMMAFTSMGAKVDASINKGQGPYVFKINGQVHHLMGSLLPLEGESPKFAQLYIYDTQNEVNNRMSCFPHFEASSKLDEQIVGGLIKMLDECNELVQLFRLARDRINQQSASSLRLRLYGTVNNHDAQYNQPTCDGIGGLIVGDIGQFHTERDIIIEHKATGLQRITKLHPKYMALQYPILFPYGEDGYTKGLPWNPAFKGKKPKTGGVSMRAFLGYQIQDRPGQDSTLLKGGRLFQQYLVDAYATLEEDRLDFIRTNQSSLRTERLKGIHEALKNGNASGSDIGKRIILPTSFTGSARYMINNYQDAMAICRHLGNPDLFITFTCNAKWPEIIEDLRERPGCKAEDRPDIISRIFKAKLDHMIKYIKSGKPFGKIESVIYTVEFQKRGLPHCHILVWVNKEYKCHSPSDVDSIISAEIPSEVFDKDGYDVVAQYLCPYEAVWRLLQFHIHFREPAVQRLCVHLPSDQNVVFKDNDSLNYVVNQPDLQNTMLTKWFEMNTQDPNARQLSYVEFPSKYVWNSENKEWTRRKNGKSLGRVAYVHPVAGELYYLRLLLNYQKSGFCFDDLRTIRGVLQPTFQAACNSLGLLGDDKEWNNAMLEAMVTASSHQLRQLFVTLVLFCDVADPTTLFEAHWKMMCDDISIKMINAFGLQDMSKYEDELKNSLLYELEKLFVASNSSLSKHHLPIPSKDVIDRLKNRSLREELNYDTESLKEQHSQLVAQLNREQKIVYDSVIKVVDHNKPEEGYDDSSVLPPQLQKLVHSTKKFLLRFGNQNNEFGNTDFVVHGIIEEQTSVEPKLSSIVPRTPAKNIGKQVIDATTPLPFTTLESQTQQIQSAATNKGVKRTLFVENEPSKAHSKHDEGSQPLSTNSTRISAEFSNLVVPKVEPTDKSPISALRSRSQAKKIKDSIGDVHSPKK